MEKSLTHFSNKFTSCRQIAEPKTNSQQSVLNLCREMGIDVYDIGAKGRSSVGTFIDRSKILPLGICEENPEFQPAAA